MSQRRSLRLVEMRAGERGTVFKIQGGIGMKRRLEAMGIRPSASIVKIAGSPFSGPVVTDRTHAPRHRVWHGRQDHGRRWTEFTP